MDRTYKDVARGYWETNSTDQYLPPNKKEEYNEEPVTWCATCKSLNIVNCNTLLDVDIDCYCDSCGSTDTTTGSIEQWEEITKQNNINNIE